MEDFLQLAGTNFRSRLIVGTGKYKDFTETKRAIEDLGRGDRHCRGAPGEYYRSRQRESCSTI